MVLLCPYGYQLRGRLVRQVEEGEIYSTASVLKPERFKRMFTLITQFKKINLYVVSSD